MVNTMKWRSKNGEGQVEGKKWKNDNLEAMEM